MEKAKRLINHLALVLFVLAIAMPLASCDKEQDDDILADISDYFDDNDEFEDESLSLDEVKSHSEVSIEFKRYRYTITATYTPVNGENASFHWIVSRHGAETGRTITGKGIVSSTVTKGGKKVFTLEFPMWVYYILRSAEDPEERYGNWKKKWAQCDGDLIAYDGIFNRIANGVILDSDDKLRKDLEIYLNEMAKEIQSDFSIWLYVIINDKRYNLGERWL